MKSGKQKIKSGFQSKKMKKKPTTPIPLTSFALRLPPTFYLLRLVPPPPPPLPFISIIPPPPIPTTIPLCLFCPSSSLTFYLLRLVPPPPPPLPFISIIPPLPIPTTIPLCLFCPSSSSTSAHNPTLGQYRNKPDEPVSSDGSVASDKIEDLGAGIEAVVELDDLGEKDGGSHSNSWRRRMNSSWRRQRRRGSGER
ncbi:unnamed protein product [Linum trigynum]|uniref:Uncharacterized protein n=1 Tax=Linum trigynum TaxID=586398 RepID=A0AAV2FVS8_9ROSI